MMSKKRYTIETHAAEHVEARLFNPACSICREELDRLIQAEIDIDLSYDDKDLAPVDGIGCVPDDQLDDVPPASVRGRCDGCDAPCDAYGCECEPDGCPYFTED